MDSIRDVKNMKFGQYLKCKIDELGLNQRDLPGFSQSYIANIIAGRNNPIKRSAIVKLAKALSLPPEDYDWLLVYSLLDKEPRGYFTQEEQQALVVYDLNNHYMSHNGKEITISLNATENDVIRRLGPPDKRFHVPPKSKWIYEKEGIHIIFVDDRVVDVMFK